MRSRRQRYLIIFILGFLNALTPFTIDLYLPAFPTVAHELHTTLARVSLTVSFYFVAYAVGQILYGPLLDRFGRKKPIYGGLCLYILANIGCYFAPSIKWLLIFRVLSALGGSAATVGANTMVRDYFPQEEVARIFSFLILVISTSPFLAPSIGSLVVTHWNWRFVFLILSGVAVLDFFLIALGLPKVYESDPSIKLRFKPILLKFKDVLKNRTFKIYTLGGALSFAGLFVFVAGAPSIFFGEFQVTPKAFGAVFGVLVSGLIGGSQLNHILVRKLGSEKVFKGAVTIQSIFSFVFLTGALFHWWNVTITGGFLFILLGCSGVAAPNAEALALQDFKKSIGSAAALLGFVQEGVGGVVAATLGLLNGRGTLPTASVIFISSAIALAILIIGAKSKAPSTLP